MVNLSNSHPQIAVKFNNGNFTVHKTRRVFSSMAIDQVHEQNCAIKLWSHSISCSSQKMDGTRTRGGQDDYRIPQVNFAQQVQGMVEVIEEMGNPFMEETKDLLTLTGHKRHC